MNMVIQSIDFELAQTEITLSNIKKDKNDLKIRLEKNSNIKNEENLLNLKGVENNFEFCRMNAF